MSATTKIKALPLDDTEVKKLLKGMQLDIQHCVDTLCSTTPLPRDVMDMFDPESWEMILFAIADIKSHVYKKTAELNKLKKLMEYKDRQVSSSSGGIKYWKDRYENELPAAQKTTAFWVDKCNQLSLQLTIRDKTGGSND